MSGGALAARATEGGEAGNGLGKVCFFLEFTTCRWLVGVVFFRGDPQIFVYFHLYFGKIPILSNIFQMG